MPARFNGLTLQRFTPPLLAISARYLVAYNPESTRYLVAYNPESSRYLVPQSLRAHG